MTNPLEIYEIVHRVGEFIQCWMPNERHPDRFDFHPRDLTACIGVCRLWRTCLTPLLWLVYDEGQMSISWRIPAEVLNTHSSHFRYALLSHSRPTFTLQATCLREVCLQSEALQPNMGLIGSNPRLTRLEVSFQYNEIYNHLRPALESLSQLKYVKLEELFLGRQENLSPFLNNNPDLQDLRLNDPTGISGFSGCRPLENLTRFEIDDVIWEENPGLQHFFHLCPNLIALNLVHRGGSAPFVRELCGILREHCPKLDWIRYRNSHSRVHGAVQAEDIVAWTQASSRLVHFDTLALTFATSIYQALMCHSVWIDTLCLKFLRGAEENVRNTSRILEHCTNLRSLKVIHASTVSDLKLEWFEEPWRTDKLESLCLQGFTVPLKRVKSIQDDSFDEMLTERHRPRIVAGKKVFRDLSQGWTPVTYEHLTRMITESAWAFRDMVFERVQYAPRLYRLTVECFGYVNESKSPVGYSLERLTRF